VYNKLLALVLYCYKEWFSQACSIYLLNQIFYLLINPGKWSALYDGSSSYEESSLLSSAALTSDFFIL
jgi:hypothetical protein